MAVVVAVPATDTLHLNYNTAYRGSHRLSVARLARSKDTGMQRSIHAIHMQTKLPTLIRANARHNANATLTSGDIKTN